MNSVLAELQQFELCVTREMQVLVETSVKALEPFQMISVDMCGDKYVTISKVLPLVHILKSKTSKRANDFSCQVSLELNHWLHHYFPNIEEQHIWAASCYLDPRFKSHAFSRPANPRASSQLDRVIDRIKGEIRVQPTPPPLSPEPEHEATEDVPTLNLPTLDSLWDEFDTEVTEVRKQQSQPVVQQNAELSVYKKELVIKRDQDPLAWWTAHGLAMPELKRLAQRYLCVPATSTPSERCFSTAGELVSQRRSNLSDQNIKMILFLNKNLRHQLEKK